MESLDSSDLHELNERYYSKAQRLQAEGNNSTFVYNALREMGASKNEASTIVEKLDEEQVRITRQAALKQILMGVLSIPLIMGVIFLVVLIFFDKPPGANIYWLSLIPGVFLIMKGILNYWMPRTDFLP